MRDKVINEHAAGQAATVIRQTKQNKSPGGDGSYVWHNMRTACGSVDVLQPKEQSVLGRTDGTTRSTNVAQCFVC